MSSLMNVNNLIGGIVNIVPSSTHTVEAVCWDITLGAAGTGFGQMILGRTSSSVEMVPDAVDHVGIIVYGYLYEFGDIGILRTAAPLQSQPQSKYPVFFLRNRETVGDTERTQEDFENWVALMNDTEFQGSCYNVVTNSCIVWAMRACIFLEVPYPENWDKICNWASKNHKVAGLLGSSGMQARKVQFKAQAAETPRRVAKYIKKKFHHREHTENGTVEETEIIEDTENGNAEETENENSEETENGNSETENENTEETENGIMNETVVEITQTVESSFVITDNS